MENNSHYQNSVHQPSMKSRWNAGSALRSLVLASLVLLAPSAYSQAMLSGFNSSSLVRNDDDSFGPVSLGFTINFYGVDVSSVYINNNGNVTLQSSYETYTPGPLDDVGQLIIAPFFADVDTSNRGLAVTYGTGMVGGHAAFGVTWHDVAYFGSSSATQLNDFQLIIIDRSDVAAKDFDFWFNYDGILWETGNASDGSLGLGGSSARVGYANGLGNTLELEGSAVNGAFLDGGPNALISGRLNSDTDGRYIFNVRGGDAVPEPTTATLIGLGIGLYALRRRRNASRLI